MKVAVVEKDPKFGGTCLLRGCIPTKALLHTAAVLDEIRDADSLGIKVAAPTLDIVKAQERKQKVVDSNSKGVEFLFKKNKVTGIHGTGRITGPARGRGRGRRTAQDDLRREVHHDRHRLGAARRPHRPGRRRAHPQLATTSWSSRACPASLVGARRRRRGHRVRLDLRLASAPRSPLIEMLPRILPIEDEEVSAELQKALQASAASRS